MRRASIAGHGFLMTIKFLQNIAAIKPLVRGGGIKAVASWDS
jgi:hypothetical protein